MANASKLWLAVLALGVGLPAAHAQNSADAVVTPGLDRFQLNPSLDPARNPPRSGPDMGAGAPRPLVPAPVPISPRVVVPAAPPPVASTPAARQPAPAQSNPNAQPGRTAQPIAGAQINASAPASAPAAPPRAESGAEQRTAAPARVAPPQTSGEDAPPSADLLSPVDNGSGSVPAPLAEPAPVATDVSGSNDWIPWAVGGLILLLAAGSWLLRRRRNRRVEEAEDETIMVAPEAAPPPAPDTAGISAPAPPAPVPPTPAPPRPAAHRGEADRPRLVIGFDPRNARVTLVGAAVGYRLTIRNEGSRAAEDVLLTGMITNADAQQQAVLATFFSTAQDMVGDKIGRIEPGQTLEYEGEMRLSHDRIVPIDVQGRKLLIPVIALNLAYLWTRDQRIDRGVGRNGAAFIVGQEGTPPRDKMAPFRLDIGPRQYAAVGARPAHPPVTD